MTLAVLEYRVRSEHTTSLGALRARVKRRVSATIPLMRLLHLPQTRLGDPVAHKLSP